MPPRIGKRVLAEETAKTKRSTAKPRGPEPERLAIAGDWEVVVTEALKKPRPAGGWPKPPKKKGRGK